MNTPNSDDLIRFILANRIKMYKKIIVLFFLATNAFLLRSPSHGCVFRRKNTRIVGKKRGLCHNRYLLCTKGDKNRVMGGKKNVGSMNVCVGHIF